MLLSAADAGGVYVVTVQAADATADLEAMVFTPTLHQVSPGDTVSTEFSIQVADSYAPLNTVVDNASLLTVTANAVPQLTGANNLPALPENPSSDTGATVASLISGQSSDSDGDTLGIAVTGLSETAGSGVWQYSTDGGGSWSAIDTGVSATSALLLAPADRVRFLPNDGFVGNPLATITFLAWDQTTGTVDMPDNTTLLPGSGGFSTTSATASITVYPVLSIGGTGTSASLDDQLSQPFNTATIGDSDSADPGEMVTITITQTDAANGSLSSPDAAFSTDAGGVYVLTVQAADATADLEAMVFTPTLHQVSPGDTVSTAFSVQLADSYAPLNTVVDNASLLTVTANAVPQLTGANNLPALPENPSSDTGATVASLISGQSSDADGDTLGIAVTGLSETAGSGVWQYSTDGGGSWSAIDTGVSATSALLLAPADRVRFLPNDGFVGNPLATITFLAWDQTTGTVDMPDNTTLLPGSGGFSTTSATASITVYPVLSIGGTGTSASLDDQTSQPFNTPRSATAIPPIRAKW